VYYNRFYIPIQLKNITKKIFEGKKIEDKHVFFIKKEGSVVKKVVFSLWVSFSHVFYTF
jgi:hypothetical protein